MKQIPLTQGQFAIVDDHWFDYLNQWKWYAVWSKITKSYYAVRNEGKSPHQKQIFMHRVVAKTPDGAICDHIHHNTLDNREEELRNVNASQSSINRRKRVDNNSGITGVNIRNNVFVARLRVKGKTVLFKRFKKFDDAVAARKDAEEIYFGEFANK